VVQVRVKRWCKRPPAIRVTGSARQTPPGARSNSARSRAARPSARVDRTRPAATPVLDGWSPNGAPQGAREQNPAYRPAPPPRSSDLRPPRDRATPHGGGHGGGDRLTLLGRRRHHLAMLDLRELGPFAWIGNDAPIPNCGLEHAGHDGMQDSYRRRRQWPPPRSARLLGGCCPRARRRTRADSARNVPGVVAVAVALMDLAVHPADDGLDLEVPGRCADRLSQPLRGCRRAPADRRLVLRSVPPLVVHVESLDISCRHVPS
jgi:hypothetical protein